MSFSLPGSPLVQQRSSSDACTRSLSATILHLQFLTTLSAICLVGNYLSLFQHWCGMSGCALGPLQIPANRHVQSEVTPSGGRFHAAGVCFLGAGSLALLSLGSVRWSGYLFTPPHITA